MKDETSARAKSAEPQPEPVLDTSRDSDEPAFTWLTGAGNSSSDPDGPAESTAKAPGQPASAGTAAAPADAGITGGGSSTGTAGTDAGMDGGTYGHAGGADDGSFVQAESRADRKAAEAAVEDAGQEHGHGAHGQENAVFEEPVPTSALQVRPPEEEVERRNAQRESAANAKPVLPRVLQVLLAIFLPFILLILAVRAVTSPLFLWVEYNRPGFPGDGYGFSTDDRMTYGSYAVDYLTNWSGPRYLGELVNRSGDKLFTDGEVSHMADVKLVVLSTFGAGLLMILVSLFAVLYLRKRSRGGVRRGLFAGSVITLVLILGLGSLAAVGWQQFFTEFHRIFFADGTWTFRLDDTLIRLFPGQFWIDAGIVIAALALLAALLTLILTWPTKRRRGLASAGAAVTADRPAE